MNYRIAGLIMALFGWTSTPLIAQAARVPGPRVSVLVVSPGISANETMPSFRELAGPTHWKRGALIGAIAGAGLWIAVNLKEGCGGDMSGGECVGFTLGTSLAFAVVGAIPGALIGGLFPKE